MSEALVAKRSPAPLTFCFRCGLVSFLFAAGGSVLYSGLLCGEAVQSGRRGSEARQ